MYIFVCVNYQTGLCLNCCFVLILLYAQVLDASFISKSSASQEKQSNSTEEPFMEIAPRIPKGPNKCCFSNEWLQVNDINPNCVGLPPYIANLTSNSSWLKSFSNFGFLSRPHCDINEVTEAWTKSNLKDYHYFSESGNVINLVTKQLYYILCDDYISTINPFEKFKNNSVEDFKELENEIAGVYLCSISEPTIVEKIRVYLSLYGMGTSCILLATIFYLYISTPKLRRKVYDKCFLCQQASLLIGFSFTMWRRWVEFNASDPPTYCTVLAFMNQYWIISSFTWLTILCIDIWLVISTKKCKWSDSRKLMIYCLSAWGFPVLISVVTFFATTIDDPDHLLKVDFKRCWFQLRDDNSFFKQPEFIYCYTFISLCLLINVCLFIHISVIIISNDCSWKKTGDSRRHEANKRRFLFYLKLFSVMGLTWFLEIISFYIDLQDNSWLVLLLDLHGNVLQTILIFVVSVCNSRVRGILKKRFFSNHKDSMKSWSSTSRNGNTDRPTRGLSSRISSMSLRSMKKPS